MNTPPYNGNDMNLAILFSDLTRKVYFTRSKRLAYQMYQADPNGNKMIFEIFCEHMDSLGVSDLVSSNNLEELRPITKIYENGYECPFCNYPVILSNGADCRNPACEVNQSAENILKAREKAKQEKEEFDARMKQYSYYAG